MRYLKTIIDIIFYEDWVGLFGLAHSSLIAVQGKPAAPRNPPYRRPRLPRATDNT